MRPHTINKVITMLKQCVEVLYDGHIALLRGVEIPQPFLAPFDIQVATDYDKGGLPMTVTGDGVYLHTDIDGDGVNSFLIPTGLLTRVLNKPFMDRTTSTITRNTKSITIDPNWIIDPTLRSYQAMAVTTALRKKRLVISIPTGGGKSHIIQELCRVLGQVLVVVHTKLLLYQMQEQLEGYDVGLVGDGHFDMGKPITIAIQDSLCSKRGNEEVRGWLYNIPALIVDECHTFSCPTGTVISSLMRNTQYRIGLSATPCMDTLLEGLLGPLEYEVKEQDLISSGHIMSPVIKVVSSPPITIPSHLMEWYTRSRGTLVHALYYNLYNHCILHNHARNQLIADLAKEYVESNSGPLIIIVSRIEDKPPRNGDPGKVSHAKILRPFLHSKGLEYDTLSGTSPKEEKKRIVQGLGNGSIKLVVAGSSILKEGVNIIQATGTIIAGAGRGGTGQSGLIQQVGRLLRPAPGKGQPTVYIINDHTYPLFNNQSRALTTECERVYGSASLVPYTIGGDYL